MCSSEQAWTHFWTTAKSHFLSHGRGEGFLGCVPQETSGAEMPLSRNGLLQAAHLPPGLLLCCSACSVFFPHASLPKTNSTRLPTQIFGIPGQPYICLCFGQEHVLSCLLQCRREGRWLSLHHFQQGLTQPGTKPWVKVQFHNPLWVCVGGVWGGICREMAIFPQISCWRGATVRTRTPAARFSWELCVGKRFNS